MPNATLSRTTFTTSRLLEFFTEKELAMQIGQPVHLWPAGLLKELLDNSLDACENADATPLIEVAIAPDSFAVRDNGPGLPREVVERSTDYAVRVSDKSYYASPTRGQLGNALKCVWAAPFVVDGRSGRDEVFTPQADHVIEVALDRIGQQPVVRHTPRPPAVVKSGTLLKVHWKNVAKLPPPGPRQRLLQCQHPVAGILRL
jgi:DNA topoisomerase VI subunit B